MRIGRSTGFVVMILSVVLLLTSTWVARAAW